MNIVNNLTFISSHSLDTLNAIKIDFYQNQYLIDFIFGSQNLF